MKRIPRVVLEENLAMVERDVAQRQTQIAIQTAIVNRLSRSGLEGQKARELLREYERALEADIARRDRLKIHLAQSTL